MRKILFFMAILPLVLTACSPKEENNRLVGTTWACEDYWFEIFSSETWYKIIQFTSNDTYTYFRRKSSDGIIRNKSEGNRYKYQDTIVTLYNPDGEESKTFIFDRESRMHPVDDEFEIYEKQ